MGIDCKAVKTIIHYSPSRNLEAYLQESGRAGRDQVSQCQAIILYNNVMLKYCDENIVAYCRNTTECRRTMILNHFDNNTADIKPPKYAHLCCDICQQKCICDVGCCSLLLFSKLHNDSKTVLRSRNISDEQKSIVYKNALNRTKFSMKELFTRNST